MVKETSGQEFMLTTLICFEHLHLLFICSIRLAFVSEAFFGLKKKPRVDLSVVPKRLP